ncbi:MAG: hypothetical protein PHT79_06325 [Syntrophomonadaceae bacterium]|nr:hypothetical protein [Syntrophomonadaceae bacterium]MDD3889115.1 hypothetical protein [Syntrophomonadaceae bacterium]MDD4549360.1 hypothetical protein [Syntrophomonadaceae bacterium]
MKKEHFFFLVLVLAAAIVTGSTIGIVNNLDIILEPNHNVLASSDNLQVEKRVAQNSNSDDVSNISRSTASRNSNIEKTDSTELMLVSQQEQEQIVDMLKYLGMTESADYSEFIRQFQQTHSLNPTGNLDSLTLDTVIRQVTINKVSDAVKE